MSTPARGRRHERRRVLALAVVAIALGGLVAIAVATPTSNPTQPRASVASVGMTGESSALYCAGLEHVAGELSSVVAIADLTSTSRVVELTATNELGTVAQRLVRVHPGSVKHVDPSRFLRGTVLAMSVVASGGGIAATEAIRGPDGAAVAPCVSRAATSWWLTGGTTARHHSTVLCVFNPYASTAVFSVSLQTPAGASVPPRLQGVVLKPHQLAAVNLHAVAPNQSPITTEVKATDGSVVVYASSGSTQGTPSLSLLAGTPTALRAFAFPVATSARGRTTTLVLAAPGTKATANATVHVLAPPGCSEHCPAPFDVSVPAGGTVTLTISPSTRVPLGARMATLVASTPGLVAVQRVATSSSLGQSAPVDDPTSAGAQTLVLVNPLASGLEDLGLVNPGTTTVHVTLETVGHAGPHAIGSVHEVAPGESVVLSSAALHGMVRGVLILVSDGPLRASGDVRDALPGSGVLAAVPTR